MNSHWQKRIGLIKKLLFFSIFITYIASCQKDDLISLRIKVKDANGKALPNASVILNGNELGRSDARGLFVKYLVIKKGEHRLEIAKNKGKVIYTPYKQNLMYYREEDKKVHLEVTLHTSSEIAQSKVTKPDAFPVLIPQKETGPIPTEKTSPSPQQEVSTAENSKIEVPKQEETKTADPTPVLIVTKTPTKSVALAPALAPIPAPTPTAPTPEISSAPKVSSPSKTAITQNPTPKLKAKAPVSRNIQSPKTRIAKADKLIASGKISSALALLKETPKNHPEYIQTLQKTSEVYLNLLNDPAKALITYEKLTKIRELQRYDKTKLLDININKAIAAFNVGELRAQNKKAGALKMYQATYGLLTKSTKLLTKGQDTERINTINYYKALSLHRIWQLNPGAKLGGRVVKEWLTYQKSIRKNPGAKGLGSLENSEVYLQQARSKDPNQIKEIF